MPANRNATVRARRKPVTLYRRLVGVALFVSSLAVLAGAGFVWFSGPLLSGFIAKNLCSGVFVAGRTAQLVYDQDLRRYWPQPLFAAMRWQVDVQQRSAHAQAPWHGQASAYFEPGQGCALHRRPAVAPIVDVPQPRADAPWPDGERVDPLEPGLGVDAARLRAAIDNGFADDLVFRRGTRAIVVVYRGRIIGERYADSFGPNTPLAGWSMAKSVTAALIGRALQEHKIGSLADPLDLGAWRADNDSRAAISFEHALGMTSGLAFDESYTNPLSDVNRMLFVEPSAAAVAASVALQHPPGAHWHYASGNTNLVWQALRERLGTRYDTVAHDWLFAPLGMRSAVIERDGADLVVGSSFIYAAARDWARFGWLMANGGRWGDRQLLDPEFIAAGVRPRADGALYGLGWWLHEPNETVPQPLPTGAYQAAGHAGQRLTIVPSHALVIVRLGHTMDPSALQHMRLINELIGAVEPINKGSDSTQSVGDRDGLSSVRSDRQNRGRDRR